MALGTALDGLSGGDHDEDVGENVDHRHNPDHHHQQHENRESCPFSHILQHCPIKNITPFYQCYNVATASTTSKKTFQAFCWLWR